MPSLNTEKKNNIKVSTPRQLPWDNKRGLLYSNHDVNREVAYHFGNIRR